MYRVWYYRNGEWFMVGCSLHKEYAWKVLIAYLNYNSYLEFRKKNEEV